MPRKGTSKGKELSDPSEQPDYARWAVVRFLKEGPHSRAEILEFLESEGFPSYDPRSINKMLKGLKPLLEIDKSAVPTTYFFKGKNMALLAALFGKVYSSFVNKFLEDNDIKLDTNFQEEQLVDKLVRQVGVYGLYTELLGWMFLSIGRNEKERAQMQIAWNDSTNSIPYFSNYFYFLFSYLLGREGGINLEPRFSDYPSKLKKIIMLIGILQENYPTEMRSLIQLNQNFYEKQLQFKREMGILRKAMPRRKKKRTS